MTDKTHISWADATGGIPYRPSNGFEGADFAERWCAKCERDLEPDGCEIFAATIMCAADDPNYPVEWREDGPSGPRCTAFDPIDPDDQPIDPSAAVGSLFDAREHGEILG